MIKLKKKITFLILLIKILIFKNNTNFYIFNLRRKNLKMKILKCLQCIL